MPQVFFLTLVQLESLSASLPPPPPLFPNLRAPDVDPFCFCHFSGGDIMVCRVTSPASLTFLRRPFRHLLLGAAAFLHLPLAPLTEPGALSQRSGVVSGSVLLSFPAPPRFFALRRRFCLQYFFFRTFFPLDIPFQELVTTEASPVSHGVLSPPLLNWP